MLKCNNNSNSLFIKHYINGESNNTTDNKLSIMFGSSLIKWYNVGYSEVSVIKDLPIIHLEVSL